MSLYRSAEMSYYHVHIPKEDAYDVVNRLAEKNFISFVDSSNPFNKPFLNSIKRFEEGITKIDLIMKEVKKRDIKLPEVPNVKNVLKLFKKCKHTPI